MASFAYTARDQTGASCSGLMMAATIAEVTSALRADGKYPTSVKPAEEPRGAAAAILGRRGIKISRAEVILISTQLSIMLETGVTITEALNCIAEQTEKPRTKSLVIDLERQVQAGSDLSSALLRHPASFPRLYVSLIAASEKSGMMSKLINRATAYMRDEQETIRRVKGALTYPGIMLAFAISTTVFLLTFVMPRFTAIYASKGAALPTPTRILMGLSGFLVAQWPGIVTAVVLLIAAAWMYLSTEGGRRMFDYFQLRLPVLGPMFRKLHLSRALRMIGTMAGAGVNLVDCVNTAHDLCDNSYYRDLWTDALTQIQAGKQLSEPMFRNRLVPRSVAQMIHVGEKSGKLAHVMEQVAGFSETELKETIVELTRYIEPAMIMIMGAIIGSVSLALMLPIFTISRIVAK